MSGGAGGFVPLFSQRCPPSKRTFNSDGTRVDEVGLKEWDDKPVKPYPTSDRIEEIDGKSR